MTAWVVCKFCTVKTVCLGYNILIVAAVNLVEYVVWSYAIATNFICWMFVSQFVLCIRLWMLKQFRFVACARALSPQIIHRKSIACGCVDDISDCVEIFYQKIKAKQKQPIFKRHIQNYWAIRFIFSFVFIQFQFCVSLANVIVADMCGCECVCVL